jgi:hypothetical protein
MKQPKKLSRSQKEKLTKKNLDAQQFVVVSETATTFTVQKKAKVGTNDGIYEFNK